MPGNRDRMNVTFIFSGEKTVQIRPSDGKYCAEFRYSAISRETDGATLESWFSLVY